MIRGDLVPLGPRLGALYCLRFVLAVLMLASTAVTAPGALARVLPIVAGYLVVANAVEVARRLRGRLPLTMVGLSLLFDGAVLATVVAVTGGPRSAMSALLLVHLLAVTLAASYRTGLKLALWDSLLLIVVHHAPASIGGSPVPVAEAVSSVTAFWGIAIAAAAFSALNERDLRRSRGATARLARMARQMEATPDAGGVITALLEAVAAEAGAARAAVAVFDEAAAWVHAAGAPTHPFGISVRAGTDLLAKLERREPVLLRQTADPLLRTLLPGGTNVVVLPLTADGALLGLLAVEWGAARSSIPASTVTAASQLASHAALAYRNARLVDEVRRLATSDGLTGVANRRTFDEALTREVARTSRSSEALSLVLIDIDHFKHINDQYGHQAGDEVLRHVGAVLEEGARLADLAARYGGEEFAVILPGASSEAAMVVAERLRIAIASYGALPVTASAGVATLVSGHGSAEQLVAAADQALYAAKQAGRDRASATIVATQQLQAA